jgi:tetratricopeptide (TPR) repeat protein
LSREVGDRRQESHTLDSLGYAHHHLGNYEQAIGYFHQSLALHEKLDDRWGQATVFNHLGDSHHTMGNQAAARVAWRRALDILDQFSLGDGVCLSGAYPDPGKIHAKLRRLGPQSSAR